MERICAKFCLKLTGDYLMIYFIFHSTLISLIGLGIQYIDHHIRLIDAGNQTIKSSLKLYILHEKK